MKTTYLGRVACVRCGADVDESDAFGGCRRCASEGIAANVLPTYDISGLDALPVENERGLFRYRALLPLDGSADVVTLNEGSTPLLRASRLGAELGVEQLYVKDESRNPTWSYKDRLAAVAVTKALQSGANTVVVATTGNHGAAVAAYAAAARLRCVVLTLESVPLTMKVLMQSYGGEVVALRTGPERWAVMAEAVAERGWVPMSGYQSPPIGSNPFGIDGYKTIAYEVFEQLARAPDFIVVPTAYGDGLAGLARGFEDLRAIGLIDRVPQLVAAEPFGPYAHALEHALDVPEPIAAGESVAFSTATPIATYQGLDALRRTNGAAVAVPEDAEILDAQGLAARTEGLFLEAAAAINFPVIASLARNGVITSDATVIALATSTGLKDIEAPGRRLPRVPLIEPKLAALDEALRATAP